MIEGKFLAPFKVSPSIFVLNSFLVIFLKVIASAIISFLSWTIKFFFFFPLYWIILIGMQHENMILFFKKKSSYIITFLPATAPFYYFSFMKNFHKRVVYSYHSFPFLSFHSLSNLFQWGFSPWHSNVNTLLRWSHLVVNSRIYFTWLLSVSDINDHSSFLKYTLSSFSSYFMNVFSKTPLEAPHLSDM